MVSKMVAGAPAAEDGVSTPVDEDLTGQNLDDTPAQLPAATFPPNSQNDGHVCPICLEYPQVGEPWSGSPSQVRFLGP